LESKGAIVGEGGNGEFVAVGVKVGVMLAVGEAAVVMVSEGVWSVGVESPALTELTVNCRMGQMINVAITSNIEELVRTTPRETLVCEGWYSPSSTSDLHS